MFPNYTSSSIVQQDLQTEHSYYLTHIGEPCLKVYASLLLLLGIPGNIVCGIIMGGNRSNRMTTRVLMIILSVSDTAVLLCAVLRYWTMRVVEWDIRAYGPVSCKIHIFSVAFTTDYAVGALCAIAVERLLVVAFPHRANTLVTVRSISLGMISFGLSIVVKNLLHFWMMGPTVSVDSLAGNSPNTTIVSPRRRLACAPLSGYDSWFKVFTKVDLISFAVLPYIILFSSNVFIYVKLRKQQAILNKSKSTAIKTVVDKPLLSKQPPHNPMDTLRSVPGEFGHATLLARETVPKRIKRRPDGVIKLLTALTLIHVCCTLPGTVFTFINAYFPEYFHRMNRDTTELIKAGLVMLVFTNNAINFFGYYVSCTSFRESFQTMFHCFRLPRGSLAWLTCPRQCQSGRRNGVRSAQNTCCCHRDSLELNQQVKVIVNKPSMIGDGDNNCSKRRGLENTNNNNNNINDLGSTLQEQPTLAVSHDQVNGATIIISTAVEVT